MDWTKCWSRSGKPSTKPEPLHWLRSPALLAGIVCFCLEFVVWLALLSLIPLSQAILIGSINIVSVAVAGRIVFGERLGSTRTAGIALIAIGVALAGGFH